MTGPTGSYTPVVGDRIVMIHPPDWNTPNFFGHVTHVYDDKLFACEEATLGYRRLLDLDNIAHHGATIRRLTPKDHFPRRRGRQTTKKKGC